MYSVYSLTDPRDGRIYYVGCTTNPEQRLRMHSGGNSTCTADRINSKLKEEGLQPVMTILASTEDRQQAGDLERHWIANFSTLVNRKPGGLPERREDLVSRLLAVMNDDQKSMPVRECAAKLIVELTREDDGARTA